MHSKKNYHKKQKPCLKILDNLSDYRKLNFRGGNNVYYDFSNFRPLRELFRVIYLEKF